MSTSFVLTLMAVVCRLLGDVMILGRSGAVGKTLNRTATLTYSLLILGRTTLFRFLSQI